MDTLTDNIIGIDFMHKHKHHYDVQTRQVKIASIDGDQIVAIKEQVCKLVPNVNFIATIFAPKNPMLSGMPAVVSIDKNNNCKIVIDNCAPYDVTIDRNDIIGLVDKETDELQLLENATISAVLSDIDKNYQKCLSKNLQKKKLQQKLILMCLKKTNKSTLTFYTNIKKQFQ